jgi:hypothetical protein
MLSNSLLFMPETTKLDFLYHKYVPFKHYIPLRADMNDILEKFDWAESH